MIEQSLDYLKSPAALASLEGDPYWPKWDSPWWHMLLLHEMDLSEQIPGPAVEAMVTALNGMRSHIFPITPAGLEGLDPLQDSMCHCAAGTMYGLLTSAGIEVESRLPWLPPQRGGARDGPRWLELTFPRF